MLSPTRIVCDTALPGFKRTSTGRDLLFIFLRIHDGIHFKDEPAAFILR